MALHEGAHDGVGLLTTNDTKAAMCKATQELLDFNALHFIREMVCLSEGAAATKARLVAELRAFSVVVEPAKSIFSKSRMTFSGKGGGQQDDLAIALQLAIFGMRLFHNREKYTPWR